MIFVPLPFVVTILLTLLFLSVAKGVDERPRNYPFLALIALAATQSMLVGLRFGYGVEWVGVLSPLLASVMAPMVLFGALHLVGPRPLLDVKTLAPHGLPLALVLVSLIVWPVALDAIIIGTFIVYAVLILRLLWSGADALRLAALDGAGAAYRALLFAAFALAFSAAVDTAITIDIALAGARHLAQLVSVGNVATLLLLSIAAAAASRGRTPVDTDNKPLSPDQPDTEATDDPEVLATVENLMKQTHLYRDVDLNLDRLARRAVIPSRQISGAINRMTGKNVSQYVNDFRIAEACDHLQSSTRPVTEIMFEVGFQTKSNFNREFRRVTGKTPLEWRKSKKLCGTN
ncbi:helix-turn-helix domain-containing protein [Sedimentitalea todarodis]|uniref:AraC family transcriptional regulator n=1 Tax=Sedimentitalea todarodis TaxID=1631240 RepID=A0ABU3VIS9_9RHOB|nr:AraC family transcriptional regulator [Sedimentitalea todarodis]MDU9006013.1 AraC family transcriptional regulator [Sedimentitalea todarodis]